MEGVFGPVPISPFKIEDSLISENWPLSSIISIVNFSVNSTPVQHILSDVNVKPAGVIKLFCDHRYLTWEHLNNIPSRLLTSYTKGAEYAVTGNFTNSVQAGIDFRCSLSPYCFSEQVVTTCTGLLIKGPGFTFVHTEIGGGASFALLSKGIKICCGSTSSTGTRLFERCCQSPEGFIELMQRSPREREARYLLFTLQRPDNLIYVPHLLAQTFLTVDKGSPKNLSGWDAATT